MTNLFLFGIDGADYHLTRKLIARGLLPNLKRISEAGYFSQLTSTIPPLTPQAWSSFACGVNPGKHGIFDFGEMPVGSYQQRLNTSEDRKTKGFWDYLAQNGISSASINMPLSYPAESVENGYVVSGMHTPSQEDLSANSEVQEFILKNHPDYRIDVMSFWYKDMDLFVREVYAMVEQRTRLALALVEKFPVDVFFITWTGLDRVLHAFYSQQDFVQGGRGWKYERVVKDIFQKIDDGLGQLMEKADWKPSAIVLSDHGFGDLKKDVYLNNYFQELGYFDFRPEELTRQMFEHPNWEGGAFRNRLYSTLMQLRSFRRKAPWQQKSFGIVDWSKTRCFSAGLFGNIYINRKDRFPDGFIEYGSRDYIETLGSLIDDLGKLKLDGKPVVSDFYLSSEIYHGPHVNKAPDLILNMQDYALITRGGSEFHSNKIFETPEVNHSGNHRMEGILMLSGSHFRQCPEYVHPPILEDILPTMLHALQLEIPWGLDGRVLRKAVINQSEPNFAEIEIYRGESQDSPTQLGDEELEKRMRALGYM